MILAVWCALVAAACQHDLEGVQRPSRDGPLDAGRDLLVDRSAGDRRAGDLGDLPRPDQSPPADTKVDLPPADLLVADMSRPDAPPVDLAVPDQLLADLITPDQPPPDQQQPDQQPPDLPLADKSPPDLPPADKTQPDIPAPDLPAPDLALPRCGDGVINGNDQCDGNALGGASCTSLGYTGGVLKCTDKCARDLAGCYKLLETIPINVSSSGHTHTPALDFDGTNLLLAWGNHSKTTAWDVQAVRMTTAGGVLAPKPISVSAYTKDQDYPAVACTGKVCLVVFNDDRLTHTNIFGALVNSAGSVTMNMISVSAAAGHQRYPRVATSGTDFLVVWADQRSGKYWDVYGARVNPSGVVLDKNGVIVSKAAFNQTAPQVVHDGSDYFVVWADRRSGTADIYGARVSAKGVVLDPAGLPLITTADNQDKPALAFGGTEHLLAWTDDSGPDLDLHAARVSLAGKVLDSPPITVCGLAGDQLQPAVAFGGKNYLVVWSDKRKPALDHYIYGARVDNSGKLQDPAGIPISTKYERGAAASFDGGNYVVVWNNKGYLGDYYIRALRLKP